MCGWAGFWTTHAGTEEQLLTQVGRMSQTLAHRGPDDEGAWVDARCGIAFGFRRLSILDLSPAGHQPMASATGRYVIVFNGEVYNFAALREELAQLGALFHGSSDTEVVLAALEEWGLETSLQRFEGMFAFALWDHKKRQLSLARDRLGEKPLYYGWAGSSLLFGSELKALRKHRDFRGEVDRGALTLYLRHNAVPAPYSIYRGIYQLQPGSMIRFSAPNTERAQPKAYWSLRQVTEASARSPLNVSPREAADQLEHLLREAVALRMIADVPLGAFLSGGVDSSTVVALMQAQSSQPVKTFSIGFAEGAFNEAPQALAVARHLGTDHTELYATPEAALEIIPYLPEIFDEPFADSSQIPTFLLAQLARQSVTVSLSGDGGDELFAGYSRYRQATRLWNSLRWIPPLFRRGLGQTMDTLGGWGRFHPLGRQLQRVSDVVGTPGPEALYRRLISHWKAPAEVVVEGFEPPTLLTDSARWPEAASFAQRMLFFDASGYLPEDIFTKVDRTTMAVGLEARIPLLDHRVVEFAWRLAPSLRVRGSQGKWILRKVLERHVPPSLFQRPKMGFSVPIGAWLRGPLREWAEELLDERRLRQEGYFHPEPIRQKWREHLSGAHDWEHYLWDVLMFQGWLERWH